MKLQDYLMLALQPEIPVGDVILSHHAAGLLSLISGQLVACDPFTSPEFPPLNLPLPTGDFPVILSIAYIKTDQRVAFACLRLKESDPVSWRMLTIVKQDMSKLRNDEYFGYPVDSGTGCFMDRSVGLALQQKMSANYGLSDELMEEMNATYRHTWSWFNRKIGDANLIAFSSGYGDGMYETYVGLDKTDQAVVIVTDFSVVQR